MRRSKENPNPRNFSLAIAVVVISAFTATVAVADGHKSGSQQGDIVDVAVSAGQFTTLAAALEAADLISTLKSEGPFTVFAPTDAAFAALPDGTVENLLQTENREQLTAILTYHVVPGEVLASDVIKLSEAATVNGKSVSIRVVDGNVMINEATVVAADVDARNGVIHVIDKVIIPQ